MTIQDLIQRDGRWLGGIPKKDYRFQYFKNEPQIPRWRVTPTDALVRRAELGVFPPLTMEKLKTYADQLSKELDNAIINLSSPVGWTVREEK